MARSIMPSVVLDRESGDIHVHAILLDEEAFRAHPGVRYPDPEELEAVAEETPSEVVEGEPAEPVEPEPIIDWSQFAAEQVAVSDVMEGDFGRIAAQTAKQVILQRIREAEREMMFAKYQDRVGDVVTGIVQQSDSPLHARRSRRGRGAAARAPSRCPASATSTAPASRPSSSRSAPARRARRSCCRAAPRS